MSAWVAFVTAWSSDFYLPGTVLLLGGLVAMAWTRQPLRRLALAWAIAPTMLVLAVAAAVPSWPRLRLISVRAAHEPSPAGIVHSLEPAPAMHRRNAGGDRPRAVPTEESSPIVVEEPVSGFQAGPQSEPTSGPAARGWPQAWPDALRWASGGLLAGLALAVSWLLLGAAEAIWLCRTAVAAPASLQESLRRIVGPKTSPPRLLLSARVGNAVALGLLRPTILLPAGAGDEGDTPDVRAVLAHEWAHIRNRDLWLLALVRLLLVMLFPHPLYWWFRRAVRASQEAVADAAAAGGDRTSYATDLVRWMRRVPGRARPRVSAVGIWEHPSHLSRRIAMLVDDSLCAGPRLSRRWKCGAWGCIVLAALGLSLVTLRAVPGDAALADAPGGAEKKKEQAVSAEKPNSPKAADAKAPAPQGLSYAGRVIDKVSRQPVQGATVLVRRSLYSSTEDRVLEETEHETDARGGFRFALTADQAAQRYMYLEFEVTHPKYARHPPEGYALSMIQKNEKLGGQPFFANLELNPGEAISGTLVKPDGTPAPGIEVLTYSKAKKDDMSDYGSFLGGKTDEKGVFRVNVVKGGEAILWLLPKEFVPSTHLVHQRRGDLGRFVLEPGIRLRGRVLDSQGKPVGNVWVNAELCGGPAKQPIEMPVSDYVRRSEVSNERGDFALAPLPAGEYQMIVSDHPRTGSSPDRVRRPVPDAFLHQKVTLEQGRSTQSVEIRAVPHVVVEIQQLDSAGKPKKTHAITLWGRSGDSGYWTDGRPDADGKILIKAPKGLGEAELSLSTNEHGATRFRWAKDGPLFNDRRIRLGTLSSDRKGLSVIYYTSPIVLVRAAAEDGAPIKEFKPHVFYAKHKRTDHQGGRWLSGIEGDVNFEKQEDGRWRSEQLLPDESFILTVEAEGYQLWSERFSLPEGAIKELDVRLKKR